MAQGSSGLQRDGAALPGLTCRNWDPPAAGIGILQLPWGSAPLGWARLISSAAQGHCALLPFPDGSCLWGLVEQEEGSVALEVGMHHLEGAFCPPASPGSDSLCSDLLVTLGQLEDVVLPE